MSRPRPVPLPRRGALALGAAAPALAALAACNPNRSAGRDAEAPLRFSWWGNPERAATTQEVIDLFEERHPGITVSPEPGDIAGYFDRLATTAAAGDEPDVITMGGAYPAEYAARDVLLDLSTVSDTLDLTTMDEAARRNGQVGGTPFGVTTGINALAMVMDPAVIEAAGLEVPDDTSWTWDEFIALCQAITEATEDGTFGTGTTLSHDSLDLWARQHGEILYTEDGALGLTVPTVQSFLEFSKSLVDTGAGPGADVLVELTDVGPEQTLIGRGRAAFMLTWSSSLTSLAEASGADLQLVRIPGESARPGVWLQSSQLYTISARTASPENAAAFVDFLVNDPDAGRLILTDRGVPAVAAVREAILPELSATAQREVAYIDDLSTLDLQPTWVGPAGSTAIEEITPRYQSEVLFGSMTPAEAAQGWFDEATAAVAG